jgi:hypothetical protein
MILTDRDIREFVSELEPDRPVHTIPQAPEACIGYVYIPGHGAPTIVYCYNKLIESCMVHGMTVEEAIEFVEYNMIGWYEEGNLPLIIRPVQAFPECD